MDAGAALIADLESPEAIRPGRGAFGDPPVTTRPLARVDAPAGKAGLADLGLPSAPADAGGYGATLAGGGEPHALGGQWGPFDTPEEALIEALRAILQEWAQAEAAPAAANGLLAMERWHPYPGCGLRIAPEIELCPMCAEQRCYPLEGSTMARRQITFTRSLGMLLLGIYLILIGLGQFGLALPGVILGLLALAAGVLIILGL